MYFETEIYGAVFVFLSIWVSGLF